jgi:hypothetical protein
MPQTGSLALVAVWTAAASALPRLQHWQLHAKAPAENAGTSMAMANNLFIDDPDLSFASIPAREIRGQFTPGFIRA